VDWIDYMLKDRQKSEFDGFLDCIIIESLHNPIADARRSFGIGLFAEKLSRRDWLSNPRCFTSFGVAQVGASNG
jgi:hypothetical protein